MKNKNEQHLAGCCGCCLVVIVDMVCVVYLIVRVLGL